MRHPLLICDRCGNVEDMEWYGVPRPASSSLGKRVVRDCELIFRGLLHEALRGTLPVNGFVAFVSSSHYFLTNFEGA